MMDRSGIRAGLAAIPRQLRLATISRFLRSGFVFMAFVGHHDALHQGVTHDIGGFKEGKAYAFHAF